MYALKIYYQLKIAHNRPNEPPPKKALMEYPFCYDNAPTTKPKQGGVHIGNKLDLMGEKTHSKIEAPIDR